MVTATETTAQPEHAFIDIIDVEHLHHTRSSQFHTDQLGRFYYLRQPKIMVNWYKGTMMFTDNYLDARTIQNYFETKTDYSAGLLYDEYNDGNSAYVVLVNISMEDYKNLLVTAESAAPGGE